MIDCKICSCLDVVRTYSVGYSSAPFRSKMGIALYNMKKIKEK